MKKCPYCAEEIQDEAIKCKHCGEYLDKNIEKSSSTIEEKGRTSHEAMMKYSHTPQEKVVSKKHKKLTWLWWTLGIIILIAVISSNRNESSQGVYTLHDKYPNSFAFIDDMKGLWNGKEYNVDRFKKFVNEDGQVSMKEIMKHPKSFGTSTNIGIAWNLAGEAFKFVTDKNVPVSKDKLDKLEDFLSKHNYLGRVSNNLASSNTSILPITASKENLPNDLKINTGVAVANLLIGGLGPIPEPEIDCLYSLNFTEVMQSASNGVLIKVNPIMCDEVSEVAFLYTDKEFVDGVRLDGRWAYYAGTYKYQTLFGAQKNVYAFKLCENEDLRSLLEKHKQDGPKKSYYKNGTLKQEAIFKDGKPDGLLKNYYENGQLKEEVLFKDGKPYDLAKAYYEDGNLKREVLFKDGVQDGPIKDYYRNGKSKQEVPYKNGKQDGLAKSYYENCNLKQEIYFKNGKRDGLSKDYYENGNIQTETFYKEDKPDGLSKSYYKNGNLKAEGICKNGKTAGLIKLYYENGSIQSEFTMKDDQKSGPFKSYYKNGQLVAEGSYKNDLEDGEIKNYYESGALKAVANFSYGVMDGICERYFENGNLIWKWNYIKGKWDKDNETVIFKDNKNGVNKFLFKNGLLEYEINIKHGRIEGVMKEYYQNGKLRTETNFLDGIPNGLCKFYEDDGVLVREGMYKKGALHGTVKDYSKDGTWLKETVFVEGIRKTETTNIKSNN